MENKAQWIWSPHWTAEDQSRPGIMLFRKKITIAGQVGSSKIKITADTRYKLYVNGQLVEFGPARGDKQIWFYDTVCLEAYLSPGENCIGISVLRYPEDPSKGNHGMFRTAFPALYVEGQINLANGDVIPLNTDNTWTCKKDKRVSFIREEERFAPLIIHEMVNGDVFYREWEMPGYEDEEWENAYVYGRNKIHKAVSPGNLYERTIPALYRKKRKFQGVSCIRKSIYQEEDWEAFLQGEKKLILPPGTKEIVEIDAGEEMTGFPYAVFERGLGAKVRFTYAEAYQQNEVVGPEKIPVKKDRIDIRSGHLAGYSDTYNLDGQGTEKHTENYMPYWFRTFRFIQIEIDTAEEPLIFHRFDYEETGYPLEVKTHGHTSDSTLSNIWEISERTLRRCMHETYEDCPYYEQLQYLMDTRSQILFTYSISGDDRLARSCIDAFLRAQRYDGLMNCSYPNCNINVIPGFSLYFIFIVHDHMMYFGDSELIEKCLPTIERILAFFHRNLTEEGYVGKVGHLIDDRFWSFIDWAKEWNDTNGVPTAGLKGPLTMESLLYVYGLQKASELYAYMNRKEDAKAFLAEATKVQKAILKYCMGKKGMLTDGPGIEAYSQHCQVFAILTETGDMEQNKRNLMLTIDDVSYTQCTVAMRFYLFRAMEKTDLYEYTNQYWDAWRKMIANHCTTCIESEAYARSECHGWGALILYELPSVILGVRPGAPGYQKIKIKPVPGYLTEASGEVYTPAGTVKIHWEKEKDGTLKMEYEAPDHIEVVP